MKQVYRVLELLEKIGNGKTLTDEEFEYLNFHIGLKRNKLWPGWSQNGIQRAIIAIEKAKMSIEGFSTGKETKKNKTQVKLPKRPKPKIILPKVKVKLS